MVYPGKIYGDHTDDFIRISMTQPVDRIKDAMARTATVVESYRVEMREPSN